MLTAGASSPIDLPEYGTQFQPLPGDDDNLYDAIEIIKERKSLYLVRWAGNDPATQKPWEPSWVPKHDCTNDLIHDWKVAKATTAAARRKRRQDDSDFAYGTTPPKKLSNRRHLKGKSQSSTATSRKPSPVPSSRPPSKPSSGKNSPVVEIIRPKKRPREKSHPEIDSAGDEEPPVPTRKKRKLLPPSRREEEESFQQSGDEYSHEVKPRSSPDKGRIAVWSQDIHPNDPVNDGDLVRHKSRQADQDHSHPTAQELDHGMPNEDDQIIIVESRTPEPNSDHRSPSLPSPHALISASGRNTSIIVPETQPSSPSLLQLRTRHSDLVATTPPTSKHRLQALGEDVSASHPSAERERNAPRELYPLPRISPSRFLPHLPATTLSNSRLKGFIPPSSQISAIEEFTSPRKGTRYDTQRRRKKPSSRGQDKEEYESHGGHLADDVQDPIEEGEEMPPDVFDTPMLLNGERLAGARRPATKRPWSEVHSNWLSSNCLENQNLEPGNAVEPVSDAQQKVYSKPSAGVDNANIFSEPSGDLSPEHSGPFSSPHVDGKDSDYKHRHLSQLANREEENISMLEALEGNQRTPGEEQDSSVSRSSITNGKGFVSKGKPEATEELGPEDAPDGCGPMQVPSGEVNAIISSPAEASSLAATGPWTQNSRLQLQEIKSPTRQLDKALGLLHRKSEEIGELEHDRKVLQDKIESLQARLREVEKQYGEVSETSPTQEERLVKLLQDNKRLSASNKSLESDKDLMLDLYHRASNAHQDVLAENNALLRDNKSLREQATAGVKQASVFWKTQVRTLETELARLRGTVKIFTDQAQRTDDDVRRRAALLPMAQKDALDALEKMERLKDKIRELGRENTSLRIEIKDWEDEAMARRKAERAKRYEESIGDELVWVCQWIDREHRTKCAALLESREELQEHFHKAGHI